MREEEEEEQERKSETLEGDIQAASTLGLPPLPPSEEGRRIPHLEREKGRGKGEGETTITNASKREREATNNKRR